MLSITESAICNMAAAHLGQSPDVVSINPPDGTALSIYCAQFYNIALEYVLEEAEWTFATKQEQLTAASVTLPDQWQYAFVLPPNMIRPLRALPDDIFEPNVSIDFTIIGQILYCNYEEVWLNYIYRNSNTAEFTAPFAVALSYYLASLIAAPLKKDPATAQAMLQMYASAVGKAMVKNAVRSRNTMPNFIDRIRM